jgi:hypothetical protein
MTTTAHPAEPDTAYLVRDHQGRPVGAVRYYLDRDVWTATAGSRVVSVYPRRGYDAAAEAGRLASVLAAHRGPLCRAGLYVGVAEPCRCPQ